MLRSDSGVDVRGCIWYAGFVRLGCNARNSSVEYGELNDLLCDTTVGECGDNAKRSGTTYVAKGNTGEKRTRGPYATGEVDRVASRHCEQ